MLLPRLLAKLTYFLALWLAIIALYRPFFLSLILRIANLDVVDGTEEDKLAWAVTVKVLETVMTALELSSWLIPKVELSPHTEVNWVPTRLTLWNEQVLDFEGESYYCREIHRTWSGQTQSLGHPQIASTTMLSGCNTNSSTREEWLLSEVASLFFESRHWVETEHNLFLQIATPWVYFPYKELMTLYNGNDYNCDFGGVKMEVRSEHFTYVDDLVET